MSGRDSQFDCSAPREVCCGNPRRCTGRTDLAEPGAPPRYRATPEPRESYLAKLGYGTERQRDKPRVRLS